jgi:type I restriction enzyme S subunit
LFEQIKRLYKVNLFHLDQEIREQIDKFEKPLLINEKSIEPSINILHKVLIEGVNIAEFKKLYLRLYTNPTKGYEDWKSIIIGNVKLKLPPIKEQQEIVRILDNLLENEQRAKELSDVIEKIDLMKKAILARAFRGELGTNNPEEESAVELLKEVLKEKL